MRNPDSRLGRVAQAVWALVSFVLAVAIWAAIWPGDSAWRWLPVLPTYLLLAVGPWAWWLARCKRRHDTMVARGEAFHP